MLCFSTSENSMQFISYASPSHVEVFSRHRKGQPSPRGAGVLGTRGLMDRAGAHMEPSQHFGVRAEQGMELHAPVPQPAWPRLCSWHQVMTPVVLDCSHPSETQPGLRKTRTFLGLVELGAQLSSPATPKGIQKPPQNSITNQLLKLYGIRRGEDMGQSPRGFNPCHIQSVKRSQP